LIHSIPKSSIDNSRQSSIFNLQCSQPSTSYPPQ
jgi:hypothetical protein